MRKCNLVLDQIFEPVLLRTALKTVAFSRYRWPLVISWEVRISCEERFP